MRLMGIIFEISVVTDDEIWAIEKMSNAFAEIQRIENLLSNDIVDSQTNLINQNAGIAPVKVDKEIFNLIDRSLKISELTHGAFDITRVYGNGANSAPHTNYLDVLLYPETTTVLLKEKGTMIDLSGISKGYIADRVKYMLQIQGVSSGVVNAGGDLITWGYQPDGKPWTVGAAAPNLGNNAISNLNISNMAVATSVNQQTQPFNIGDAQNKPGLAVSGVKSVSVLSPSAELADAMAIHVMMMGVRVSLNLINRLNQLACVITNNRKKVYTSKNLSYR